MEALYDTFDLPTSFINTRIHCVRKRKRHPRKVLEVDPKEENMDSNENVYLKKRDLG